MSTATRTMIRTAAAIIATCALTSQPAAAQVRNCPVVEDQLVLVNQGQPTAFRLLVFDLGDGEVSIFQFPLGGILQQTGATPLDFVFVPDADFNGTTEFTYRVTPPFGCPRTVQLGSVTLAGGTASGTAAGLTPPPAPTICGVGLFAPMAMLLLYAARSGRFPTSRRDLLAAHPRRPRNASGPYFP